jgi:DNA (cytosine-5)-methyltransferase 1
MRTVRVVDLFCGAGGATAAMVKAASALDMKLEAYCYNHWDVALETHAINHPWAEHECINVVEAKPSDLIKSHVDVLLAGPECTHHSVAAGGKPRDDQSRSSAWCILRWCQELYVREVIIENVPEFAKWGPLGKDRRPLKSRKGETFNAFLAALRSLGYRVEWRILTAADYGDATTRRRLFIRARRGNRRIVWPEATHTRNPRPNLFRELQPWRPAREIIDWSIPGESIFTRRRPLADNTLRRIAAGIERFWGAWAEPFLVLLNSTDRHRLASTALSMDAPLPTVTGSGHIGLVQPFIVPQFGERTGQSPRNHGVADPLPSVTGHGAGALVRPFLVKYYGSGGSTPSCDVPLDTVTARDRFGLVEGDPVRLDIRFRMLQPHELAAAHSFPSDYVFCGCKRDQVKQIGNSWPLETGCAIEREAVA